MARFGRGGDDARHDPLGRRDAVRRTLSPAHDHEYFGDGTAEELSTRLARVPGLKVAACPSAFSFKSGQADAKTIGRALNVDALLEGSVRQEKERVRIAVRLVDTREGYQIWADSWECDGDKVLAMQDDIATGRPRRAPRRAAPTAAAPTATSTAKPPRPTLDFTAYHLYLQGRFFWHQRTRDGLTKAAALFDRPPRSPRTMPRHIAVSPMRTRILGFYDHLPPREPSRERRPRRAARSSSTITWRRPTSLGYVALYYDWDWDAAERAFNRAVELNPNYSIGHQWRAATSSSRAAGSTRPKPRCRRAQAIDPLSLIASAALGWVQFHRGNFDAAAQQCQRTIELNANFQQAWLWGGLSHEGARPLRRGLARC